MKTEPDYYAPENAKIVAELTITVFAASEEDNIDTTTRITKSVLTKHLMFFLNINGGFTKIGIDADVEIHFMCVHIKDTTKNPN